MDKNRAKIAIGADHAGYWLKEKIKQHLSEKGYSVKDFGTHTDKSTDYPDHIHPLARAVTEGEYSVGIIMCGSGNGASMTANKHQGVRAALCWMPEIAHLARAHNDANIIALPARFIEEAAALEAVDLFLKTPFDGGRHMKRVKKITLQEKRFE